ncbi:MAG: N-acetylmuramoyl-L-alanine amidase [Paludibacter sp.]|nr:N-acetylmuramoyl-L-alanine amidase [Paludibacter sp.]
MKTKIILILIFSFSIFANAQRFEKFRYNENDINPIPSQIINDSVKRNTPSAIIIWDNNLQSNNEGFYSFRIKVPISFSFFGVGWLCDNKNINPKDFILKYRTKLNDNQWTDWKDNSGITSPAETPTNLYWSDIIFIDDSILHDNCEIMLYAPNGEKIKYVRIDFVNMLNESSKKNNKYALSNDTLRFKSPTEIHGCPQPVIIPRSDWCNGIGACNNPTFTPKVITPTHVIMHHGASPDTYSDGYAVVRSYWDYHVNTKGWDDIAYNYLIDKFGNIFQGRYNPDNQSQDIQGAHAESSNSKSIGICFLGNTDVTTSTSIQLSKLEELLAWWFNWRGYDPTSSANILSQDGTSTLYLPRICGHRDVKPTDTCPGNNLYNLLSTIRTDTKNKIVGSSVSGTPPSNDNCANAILLTDNTTCSYTYGTIDYATDDGFPNLPSCNGKSSTQYGVFYKFIAATTSAIIAVEPNVPTSSGLDAVVVVYKGTSCYDLNEIGCLDPTGYGNVNLTVSGLIVGQTYWIRIYDFGASQPTIGNGGFRVCVSHTSADVEDVSASGKIKIYPNPTTGKFEISEIETLGDKCKIEIFNHLGMSIYVSTYENIGKKISLDLSSYPVGMYIVRLSNNGVNYQRKVIKK